jgi:formiminotetrahydrofolate cyclodeaminase
MPKNSPDYAGVMASATLRAAEAPLEMMRCCCRLIALLEELREKASPLLLSDVGCASEAARSALTCAAMNVFANTRMLPDNGKAQDLAAQAESMLSEYVPRAQAVSDSVMGCLREPKT